MSYNDKKWAELDGDCKSAAFALGFDAVTWDSSADTQISSKSWADLSPIERGAARTLGYTPASCAARTVTHRRPLYPCASLTEGRSAAVLPCSVLERIQLNSGQFGGRLATLWKAGGRRRRP